ncbi:TlpA family protein disulfide reductase [Zunongwangia sp. HGR-M22]|uniref:TlpA family protein disulfide reductase n=1 Tax=Zunongwangia sp. HGR-M22 TaxID=3015168 RepID=UPI0022DE8E6A|nr:hypothetical protein [Zunongwangia sp. HGR-M22]WBL26664.1 hypothetical protein PBT91_05190 [Zunongwangia sp. HGR-M22]
MRKFLLFSIISSVIFFISCKNDRASNENIYIGGKIINPNTNYIIISKGQKPVDTVQLNENNEFGKYLPKLDAGIYTFQHNPENQIVYLEPGDSIIVWVNTYDFDQSLNFSGRGSEESSFLLDLFLRNRANNNLVLDYYKIKPEKFKKISDSIHKTRMTEFNQKVKDYDLSENFLELAKQSIDYEFYDLRERYTYLIKKYNSDYTDLIPEDFNSYRDSIDFNNKLLQNYYVYTNTIDDYLRTRALEYCIEKHKDRDCYNISNFQNVKRRATLIDSLSNTPSIKNKFLDILLSKAVTMTSNEEDLERVLNFAKSINYANLAEINKLAEIQTNYFIGKSIADFTILDDNGKEMTYKDIIDRKTIVYFWSTNNARRYLWQFKTIQDLREKYPELDFIGINLDIGQHKKWLQVMEENNYDTSNQYQLSNRSFDEHVATKYLYRINFLDKDAVIVKGDEALSTSAEFESKLLEFINN